MASTIFQYWDTPGQPDDVAESMATFRLRNPALEYRAYDREAAAAFIRERFGARHAAAFAACAVPAMQADYFRYCAVLAEGGFYADADARCLGPLAPLLEPGHRGVLFRRDNGNVVNGCFGFRAPGAPLLQAALEVATRGIEQRLFQSVWTATGPGIFTFLHLLTDLSPAERRHPDFDHIDPETTMSVRLCDAVARGMPGDAHALFEGVALRPFAALDALCPEAGGAYKQGDRHWVSWKGSIYA